MKKLIIPVIAILLISATNKMEKNKDLAWLESSKEKMEKILRDKYGADQKERINLGLKQVTDFWRAEDGDAPVFESFVEKHFAGDQNAVDIMFNRFQDNLESLDGHMLEILLKFRWQSDLDLGPIESYDEIFAAYSPSDHVADDFFKNKLAFVILLNFPLSTLDERLQQGEQWSRRQWAETRLAQRFDERVPAEVNRTISEASAIADQYIAQYNIWMHHLLDNNGKRLFPEGMRLLSHWNLRDEIKAQYSAESGLARQRMIQKVMERIVDQTIPRVVIDNPFVDWNPFTNQVTLSDVFDSGRIKPDDLKISEDPEPDTRYQVLRGTFLAVKKQDPYSPTAPTHIQRSFDLDREIPEARVKKMFEDVLTSDHAKRVAALIKERLGRDLQPFDIWYNGFKPRGLYKEAELDKITREKYPTVQAYAADMPRLLTDLGFSSERAAWLVDKIVVDPARGSGHAWGAQMRGSKAHLRTRVAADGMDYKGYNIAVHEMGHNVEQTFSLYSMDFNLLEGVPNTAFTEALAFVFQARDMELLGLAKPDPDNKALTIINDFWDTFEIAGVALVDIAVWHWMYENPDATSGDLKEATLKISRDIWNRYYQPLLGQKDVILLGVYSHMIHSFLYLPNYPVGHLIAHQIEEQIDKTGRLGEEFERMCRIGNIAPDLWMKEATGSPVGAEALLNATARALEKLK